MADSPNDKDIERDRYDCRAANILAGDSAATLGPDGAAGVPIELRSPYIIFEALIEHNARPGCSLLDLCCGNGQYSLIGARQGAKVSVLDIAPHNIELTLARARSHGIEIDAQAADAESLPWKTDKFDIVTCAGSLSYVDLDKFLGEVLRVLRSGGVFIFVDSLSHNPFYRLNRWRRYRRGDRTLSTLQRMPTLRTLARIRTVFPDLTVTYHGIFSFLFPLLKFAGRERAARYLDLADRCFPILNRHAFKVVGIGHSPKPSN